jgi:hypothetical protein
MRHDGHDGRLVCLKAYRLNPHAHIAAEVRAARPAVGFASLAAPCR